LGLVLCVCRCGCLDTFIFWLAQNAGATAGDSADNVGCRKGVTDRKVVDLNYTATPTAAATATCTCLRPEPAVPTPRFHGSTANATTVHENPASAPASSAASN